MDRASCWQCIDVHIMKKVALAQSADAQWQIHDHGRFVWPRTVFCQPTANPPSPRPRPDHATRPTKWKLKFEKYKNPLGFAVKNEKPKTLRKVRAASIEHLKFQNDENPLGYVNFEKIFAVRTEKFKFQKYQNPVGFAVKKWKAPSFAKKYRALNSEILKF